MPINVNQKISVFYTHFVPKGKFFVIKYVESDTNRIQQMEKEIIWRGPEFKYYHKDTVLVLDKRHYRGSIIFNRFISAKYSIGYFCSHHGTSRLLCWQKASQNN